MQRQINMKKTTREIDKQVFFALQQFLQLVFERG